MNIQLFINTGDGFSEKNSLIQPIIPTPHPVFIFDLSPYENISQLRLDPLDNSVIIEVKELLLTTQAGEINLTEYVQSNADCVKNNIYYFKTVDPQIYFHNLQKIDSGKILQLTVCLRYCYVGKKALQQCFHQTGYDIIEQIAQLAQERGYLVNKFIRDLHQYGLNSVIAKIQGQPRILENPEQFVGMVSPKKNIEKINFNFANPDDVVLIISHDASRTGAPLVALNIARQLRETCKKELIFLFMRGGDLMEDFKQLGQTLTLNQSTFSWIDHPELVDVFFKKLHLAGVKLCIANTAVAGIFIDFLEKYKFSYLNLIHELNGVIEELNLIQASKNIGNYSWDVVFAAPFIKQRFIEKYPIKKARIHIKHQGVNCKNNYVDKKDMVKAEFFNLYGIPPTATVILGSGMGFIRKGADLFLEVADHIFQEPQHRENIYFVWLGEKQRLEELIKPQLPQMSYAKNLIFIDSLADPTLVFARATLYLLTSREDPFPTVVLDMHDAKVPVLFFDNMGGIQELILDEKYRIKNFDTKAMAKRTIELLNSDLRADVELFKNYIDKNGYREYVLFLINLLQLRQQENKKSNTHALNPLHS